MEKCYLCDSQNDLSKDHIPPQGFFAPPLPDNLITVPCCRTCHGRFNLDDEAFRAFVASHRGISEQGMWIYREKVLGSSLRRSPKLARNILNSIVNVDVEIDGIRQTLPLVHFPLERGDRFLERIAKGMLATFYPSIDRNSLHYKIWQIVPNQEIVDILYQRFNHGQRGNGAFRFWYLIKEDHTQKGLWVFVFYDQGAFCVSHSKEEI